MVIELVVLKLLLNVMPWQAMSDFVVAVPQLTTFVPPASVLVPIQRSLATVGTLPGIQLELEAAENDVSMPVPTQMRPALLGKAAKTGAAAKTKKAAASNKGHLTAKLVLWRKKGLINPRLVAFIIGFVVFRVKDERSA
jgi:hypothetical protein